MEDESPSALTLTMEALRAPRGLMAPPASEAALGDGPPTAEAPAPATIPNPPNYDLYIQTVDFIAANVESDPETALMLCVELRLRLELDQQGAMLADESLH